MIDELEIEGRLLDPGLEERRELMDRVFAYAERYLEAVADAPAYFDRPDGGSAILDSPINEQGIGLEAALALIEKNVDSVGLNTTSGRFLGYIPGGGLFHSALGDFLAAVSNRYAGVYFASPGAVRIENQLIRWMAKLIGFDPQSAGGYLGAGGSIANLTAVVTARDYAEIEGERIVQSVVYLTEHAHHCIDKALRLAGLRTCIQRKVRVDARYRMDAEALAEAISSDRRQGLNPWMIVASAGTTNTGAIDPLSEIGDIAQKENLWYHIDGAYGAFFALCPEGKARLQGIEKADSVVMDPHKTLFLPYGTGALVVKDRDKLLAAHSSNADYMQDAFNVSNEISPGNLSPELTKHFRGLRLWLPLQILGLAPFRAALAEKLELARYFHTQMGALEGWEVGPEPDLSVVTYRFIPKKGDPDLFNRRLVERIQREGRVFVSSTRIKGLFTLRMAAVSFRTHRADIDTAISVLSEAAAALEASG